MTFAVSWISITSFLTIFMSLVLVVLSILTINLTRKAIDHDFAPTLDNYYKTDLNATANILLRYDFVNEDVVLASTSLTTVGGCTQW
jgi:hypothetical protein